MLKNILISKLFDIELLDVVLGKFVLDQAQKIILDEKLKLLNGGMPLDYVVGKVKILGLELTVNQHTLIPREETEYWLTKINTPSASLPPLRTKCRCNKYSCTSCLLGKGEFHTINFEQFFSLKPSAILIDLGSGTGIIGLYLSHLYKEVYLVDIESNTLKIAQQNIDLNAKTNCQTLFSDGLLRIETVISKNNKWDLVANLPYLPTEDIKKAKEYKVEYEPAIALYSGTDGLELFNSVLKQIEIMENKPINVLFELDPRNIQKARLNLNKLSYQTEIWLDQNGIERVLVGRFMEIILNTL